MPPPAKILVADSDTALAMRLGGVFLRQGWTMVSAADSLQLHLLARKDNPSAIVLSSTITGGDAVIMLKRLRSSAYTASTPVLVLLKTGGPPEAAILTAGASEVLDQADPQVVCEAVRRQLGVVPQLVQAPVEVVSSPLRIAALGASDVLDTATSRLQDSLTNMASSLLQAPVALLSIVDKDRQFFKSQRGLPEPWASRRQTPLSHSFCQWVVSAEEELIVNDARQVPALATNLAVRDLSVISYAGIPVHAGSGESLGSFCAIDSKPRDWSHAELAHLRNLARISEAAIIVEMPDAHANLRLRALGNIIMNAAQLVRRIESEPHEHVRSLLMELIEEQSRDLLRSVPVSTLRFQAAAGN